jgi:hypothetical protein
MAAIRAERDYIIHEDFMKVGFHTLDFYRCAPYEMGPWCSPYLSLFTIELFQAQAERRQEARVKRTLQRGFWQGVIGVMPPKFSRV